MDRYMHIASSINPVNLLIEMVIFRFNTVFNIRMSDRKKFSIFSDAACSSILIDELKFSREKSRVNVTCSPLER